MRLTPPLPRGIVEAELITEYVFYDTIGSGSQDRCKEEFYRRLPKGHHFPSWGLAASSWKGFYDDKVHCWFIEEIPFPHLTLIGRERLSGLRDEANSLGVNLPG